MLGGGIVSLLKTWHSFPKKALIKMSMPLIVSLLISSFYNLIDAAWVSGLGADALAGVGFFTPVFMVLVGFGNGLGAGAAFAISKYLGEENKIKADNASMHSIFLDIIVSIILTIILLLLLNPILNSMGAGSTIGYAADYGNIILIGSIFIILSNALYGIFRGEGDTTRPMYAMVASAILNMILDPIFIYTLNMGVKGAAIATIISSIVVRYFKRYCQGWNSCKYSAFKQRIFCSRIFRTFGICGINRFSSGLFNRMENCHNWNNPSFSYWNGFDFCHCCQLWGSKL